MNFVSRLTVLFTKLHCLSVNQNANLGLRNMGGYTVRSFEGIQLTTFDKYIIGCTNEVLALVLVLYWHCTGEMLSCVQCGANLGLRNTGGSASRCHLGRVRTSNLHTASAH